MNPAKCGKHFSKASDRSNVLRIVGEMFWNMPFVYFLYSFRYLSWTFLMVFIGTDKYKR